MSHVVVVMVCKEQLCAAKECEGMRVILYKLFGSCVLLVFLTLKSVVVQSIFWFSGFKILTCG